MQRAFTYEINGHGAESKERGYMSSTFDQAKVNKKRC